MSEAVRRWISLEDYLEREERATERSEYFNGEIFAMAGGTPEHNLILGNVLGELRSQLAERPCLVFPSEQKVKVAATGLNTYPDVSVVCADPQYAEPRRSALLNPIVIVEVLSESTEAYDRGDKFHHYRQIPSLQEYVLVASDRQRIERLTRQDDRGEWLIAVCDDPEGAMQLPSIGCGLSIAGVYQKVVFPPREPGARRRPQ